MEIGRSGVVYPDVFNQICRALHNRGATFAGWEPLEAMGYETDGSKGKIVPPLQIQIESMTEAQQRAMLAWVKATMQAQGALS